ncbi:MAG: hypothetical protein H5T69_04685 [Chloroflexi bacterium]|nr:hypothetical protein [Chloroflexota bacterium]
MQRVPPVPPRFPIVGGAALLIGALVGLIGLILTLVIWWRICSKAGYSGALGLLMFIPLANIILLLVLAFDTWPIEQELARLRDLLGQRSE